MAGGLGFEPRLAESESAVLPLDDPPSAGGLRSRASKPGRSGCAGRNLVRSGAAVNLSPGLHLKRLFEKTAGPCRHGPIYSGHGCLGHGCPGYGGRAQRLSGSSRKTAGRQACFTPARNLLNSRQLKDKEPGWKRGPARGPRRFPGLVERAPRRRQGRGRNHRFRRLRPARSGGA